MDVCACDSVTEMGSDFFFFSFLPTANEGDVQSCFFFFGFFCRYMKAFLVE